MQVKWRYIVIFSEIWKEILEQREVRVVITYWSTQPDFTNDIQKLSGIQLDVKDDKPYAILSKVADKFELKFALFIYQFDEFKATEQVF